MRANNFCACVVECPVAGSFQTLGVVCAAANETRQKSRPATASQFQTRIGLGFLIGASLGRCSVLGQPCPVACLRSRRFNFPICRVRGHGIPQSHELPGQHLGKSSTAGRKWRVSTAPVVAGKNPLKETKRTSTRPEPCHTRLSRSERHHEKRNLMDNPG